MNELIRAGIVGGAGCVAGELLRLLLNHPAVDIAFVNSESHAGTPVTEVHGGLYGETDLRFTDQLPFEDTDVLFFCCEEGLCAQMLTDHYIPADVKIIDLSGDFRLQGEDNDFVYGLPELNGWQLQGAQHVANPGHLATAILLGLLPLAARGWLDSDISMNAFAGTTAEGLRPSALTHFSWRCGNLRVCRPFCHGQLPEIRQALCRVQPAFDAPIDLIPYLGDFTRGVFATAVTRCEATAAEIAETFSQFYDEAPFTHYVEMDIDLKQVTNTNKCLVHAELFGEKVLVTVAMDNLLKGGAGQAVQNMNLMFGLEETAGLRLKPSAF